MKHSAVTKCLQKTWFIFGEFLVVPQTRPFPKNVIKSYFRYFGDLIGYEDKQWNPIYFGLVVAFVAKLKKNCY